MKRLQQGVQDRTVHLIKLQNDVQLKRPLGVDVIDVINVILVYSLVD